MKSPILVFIDAGVDNYQQLFDGVVAEAQPFVLNTTTDGIQQIDQILQQYPGQKTVHIISHGAPGCLYLGNTQLSLGTLKQYAPLLGQWDIDNLLLYGCHVAAGDAGEEFVSKLQGLTGANIAASKSLTGAAVKGGNWELELTTSQCETSLALSEAAMVAYSGVLQVLNADDYAALRALYEGTNGANWINNTGWSEWDFSSSTPPDASVVNNWHGVTVSGDRVTRLRLGVNRLTGEIPEQLGNLSNLQDLRLAGNKLTGEIPEQLGNLSNLEQLNLRNNELTGEIPEQLGNLSNLENLNLSSNELTGEIPEQLGNLSNLQRLDLFNNQLTGEIPEQLGNLSNLQNLFLSFNELTGEIPEQLGNLSNLQNLRLNRNQLTGEIPEELGNLSNLQGLRLYENQLTGEIPEELGNLSNLRSLSLDRNQLTGEIPEELGNLSNLQYLTLNRNQLTGEIPAELGNLSNLQSLSLYENQLTGEIPAELGNLSNLQTLYLFDNELTGEIPEQLGNLSNLRQLYLNNNELTGEIPAELGNLSNLRSLWLQNNQLTGEIPAELGNFSNLRSLWLQNNQLTGEIPQSVNDLDANKRLDNPPYVETEIPDQTTTTDADFNLDISNNFSDINQDISTYSAEGLPDGLSINQTTGVISGTPTAGGNYTITVTVSDSQLTPAQAEDTFDIEVEQVNQPPTDISLDPITIDENVAANTAVGTLSTVDPETGDTFTYALVAGEGDTDNKTFTIDGDQLKINSSPDFETQSTYNIRVQTTDAAGETFEEELTININDVNETPEFLEQSFDIAEKSDNQTIIGTLNATDPEDDELTFSITNNVDPDADGNFAFVVDGDRLLVNDSDDLDRETNSILNITIEVSDGELTDEATVTVNLSDVGELTIIESFGTATFAKDSDDTYWIIDGDQEIQLQNSKGKTYSDRTNRNWDGVAVEANDSGGYRVLLQGQNNRSGQAYVWTTDADGVIIGGSGWKSGAPVLPWEEEFNIDLNGDEIIGNSFTTIESFGTATFAKNADGRYWIINGDEEIQLQNSKGKTYSDITNRHWDGAAVETDDSGGYRFLLQGQNRRSGQAYVWSTDADGVIIDGSGWKSGAALLPWEEEFNIDINGDEIIGNSFTTIESEGIVTFAKNADGSYWIINGDQEIQLQNNKGKTYSDITNRHWDGAAVETDDSGGYRFLLQGQNRRSGQAYVWTTDADGVIIDGSGWKSGDALLPWEEEFNIDINGDEIIGNSFTTIESFGTATFAKNVDDSYWIINGDQEIQLQNSKGKTYSDITNRNWDGAAVETDDSGGYRFLLQGQNRRSGQAYVWSTDADGVIIDGSGWKSGDALLPWEQEFNIDII
ncbi:MAG: DUF4347 domain-containing protein [Okeania sp. SIO3I5]|uniref:DUF4347 domain-containing protein n=1 Tax=Okeania sp. SIO3I5 TaxID=2607805 RepID=UPI0013BA9C80|nr:DUF4347 domain-containing protein [Okeania sp. SIO3I5]NEQ37432.1 DUF4347 domain-containing protein [Okeania sp. SIO3I5]